MENFFYYLPKFLIIRKWGDSYYILNNIFFVKRQSGKVSVEKIKLNSSVRGCDNNFLNVLKILVGMLFIPIAFLSFKNLRWSPSSTVVLWVRKRVFSLGFFNDSWNWDSVLTILASIFAATELEKMIKIINNFVFFSYKSMIYFQTAWCKFRLGIEVDYFFYPLPNFERVSFIFLKKIFKMWFFAPSSEICYEIFISFI